MKNSKDPTIPWLNALGGILLALCFIALIVGVIVFFAKKPRQPVVSEIHLQIAADSTGMLSHTSQASMDSLISMIASQNNEIKYKYDYYLDQKAEENGLLSFGGIIISIIIAIFGFFGYRSFQSIEERAEKNAEGKAKEKLDKEMGVEVRRVERKAMTEIQKRFENEYNTKLKEEVAKQLNDNYNEQISARLQAIDAGNKERENIKKDFEWFKTVVSALQSQGLIIPSSAPQSESMKSLAEDRQKVKDKREGGEQ